MKIGLFGGSFNPIHKGHIKIAKEALEFLNLDKIIFIPCQKNPFKKDIDYVDGVHRFNMIKLVLEDKMEISDFEIKRKGNSYSIDTIKYFKNIYKNDELFFIIGSDNLTKLPKWKNISEISKLAKLVVFKRNKDINKTNIKKFGALLMNNQIYNESSSSFLKGNFFNVEESVRFYIGKHKLYFQSILKSVLNDERYRHSLHTRDFAIELAKSIKYDVEQAAFSGMVHDIAKYIANDNKEYARELIRKYEPQNIDFEDYKLHQEVGYIILKHFFNVENKICHAVRIHTSFNIKASTLDKIVFLADKLCKGRKFEGIQKIRKITLENLDEGLKLVMQRCVDFNKSKGIIFTKEQEKIYEKWTK